VEPYQTCPYNLYYVVFIKASWIDYEWETATSHHFGKPAVKKASTTSSPSPFPAATVVEDQPKAPAIEEKDNLIPT
jgi:hypothetical protein